MCDAERSGVRGSKSASRQKFDTLVRFPEIRVSGVDHVPRAARVKVEQVHAGQGPLW